MRLVLSWLRDFVDVHASAEQIAERIGLRGFEVASVVLLVAAVGGVVLGARRPAPRGPDEAEPFTEQIKHPEPELQTLVMGAETTFPVTHVPPREGKG